MPDYKAMYFELFRASVQAMELLQAAQAHAEQQFLEADPPPLRLAQKQHPSSVFSGKPERKTPSGGSLIETENFSALPKPPPLGEVARRKP